MRPAGEPVAARGRGASAWAGYDPAAGGHAVALTVSAAHNTRPVWSPDGSRIAFRRGHRTLHTLQPDGSELRTLASREERPGVREMYPESGYYELVWSPDSTALLYGFFELGGDGQEVFRIASGGGAPRLLTRSVLDSAAPVAWLKGEK